jgi:hypothetical protein
MKFLAFLVLASAWASFFSLPTGTASRVVQMLVFGSLGALLTLAGGFQYWWDSTMLPDQKSAFILLCGLGTLASQTGSLLQGILGGQGGTELPKPESKKRWRK